MIKLIPDAGGKIATDADSQPEFDTGMIPFDAEIEAIRQQYCASSGRPLAVVPAQVVTDLITIHGRTTCIKILQMQQIKYSYDWQWLNNEGLDNLAEHRPAEYFIYATSKLLQDVTLHNELMRMNEAAEAWRNLESIDDEILIPINELVRRLLARYKREKLNPLFKAFINKQVQIITKSIDNLVKFQLELTDLIQTLIAERKKHEFEERGMSNFKAQKMIRALSKLEIEIGSELNDFDMVTGRSSEVMQVLAGDKYRETNTPNRYAILEKTLTAEPSGGFSVPMKKQPAFKITLKIGGNK